MELCDKRDVAVYRIKAGDEIRYGDVRFSVLHPSAEYVPDSKNAYSLVMKLTVGDNKNKVTALLTGDVCADGERIVAQALYGDIDIYKAAHHGSKNSNISEIINAASPRLAVISCGEGNSYGHPHMEAVENFKDAGSKILVTKDVGNVMVSVRNGGFRVKTYLDVK
jgi:competence protein ComEC